MLFASSHMQRKWLWQPIIRRCHVIKEIMLWTHTTGSDAGWSTVGEELSRNMWNRCTPSSWDIRGRHWYVAVIPLKYNSWRIVLITKLRPMLTRWPFTCLLACWHEINSRLVGCGSHRALLRTKEKTDHAKKCNLGIYCSYNQLYDKSVYIHRFNFHCHQGHKWNYEGLHTDNWRIFPKLSKAECRDLIQRDSTEQKK